MSKEITVGDIYIDCGYHAVRCEESNRKTDSLSGVSLIDGSRPRNCSFVNCNVRKITQQEANQVIEIWKKEGERGAMRHFGWTEEAIDQFMRDWRTSSQK